MVKASSQTKLISWVDYSLFHSSDLNWIKGSIAIGLCVHGLALRLMMEFAPPSGILYGLVHCGLAVGALLSIILFGPGLLQDAALNWRHRTVTVYSGFLLGILILFSTSLVASFQRQPWTFFEVIPVALTSLAVARYWIARKKRVVEEALPVLIDRVERCSLVEPNGSVSRIPLTDVKVGDEIKISNSQVVPVDGVIVAGEGFVSEASLSGATFSKVKQVGDPILAGSLSQDGVFSIKALAPYVPRKMKAVSNPLLQSGQESTRSRISQYASVGAIGLLGILGFTLGLLNSGLLPALTLFSTILILGLALVWVSGTPIHHWTGLVHFGKRGLFGKKPSLVAELAEIDHAYFGKTGVLSHEELTLERFFVMPAFQDRENWIRSLVYQSSRMVHHPLVNSLSGVGALIEGEPVLEDLRYKIVPGYGIEATLTDGLGKSVKLRIGEPDFVMGKGGQARVTSILEEHDLQTGRRIWIGLDGRLCAIALLKESWNVPPQPFFAHLEKLDIKPGILTGDTFFNDMRLDGLNCAQGLTARDKQERLENSVREGGKVLFVGDGLNDYRAMSSAHVSIAMRHAPDAVLASASAILKSGNLSALVFGIPYCRRIVRLSRINRWMFSGFFTSASAAAIAGFLNPMTATICFLGSFAAVWFQSFLLGSSTLSGAVEQTGNHRLILNGIKRSGVLFQLCWPTIP